MIEYQLSTYIKANLAPSWEFVINLITPDVRRDLILVQGDGGPADPYGLIARNLVSLKVFCDAPLPAIEVLNTIYNGLRSLYYIEFPEFVDGTITIPERVVYQVSPMAVPQYLGAENGKHTAGLYLRVITE